MSTGMNERLGSRRNAGLCGSCAHAKVIVSSRGSEFYLCQRSATDPRYPKYPALPVRACGGYEPAPTAPPATS